MDITQDFVEQKLQQQGQTLVIVEGFSSEVKFLHVFSFSFFFFHCPFFLIFHSSEQTPKQPRNRREVPIAKKDNFLCENLIFGPHWIWGGGHKSGPFEGDFAFMFFFFFSIFVSSLKNVCSIFFVVFILSKKSFIAGIRIRV